MIESYSIDEISLTEIEIDHEIGKSGRRATIRRAPAASLGLSFFRHESEVHFP